MSYRFNDGPPPKPEDRLMKFEVRNGSIINIAFPCFYLDVVYGHDHHYHDHIGWPAPNYVGQACQYADGWKWHRHHKDHRWDHIDWGHPTPIEFESELEGYDDVYVVMDDETDTGLTLEPWFEGNIIYLAVNAQLPYFEDKPKDFRFTLFAHSGKNDYGPEKIDQILRAAITVLPGRAKED